MKKRLSAREYVLVASMLFGLFLRAGNLTFPVYMGQMAGHRVWSAIPGFLITGVGLPLMAVAALGISRSNGLYDLSSKVSKPYGMFFTCLLYLTIGPFFAIPRCATTSFTVGLEHISAGEQRQHVAIDLFLGVLCGGALVLAASGEDFNVGWQAAESDLFSVFGGIGDCLHAFAHGAGFRGRAAGGTCREALHDGLS